MSTDKIKSFFIIIACVICAPFSFAQNKNTSAAPSRTIDSLLILIRKDKPDTNKVDHLYELCWEYINIGLYDTALYFGNSALQLAQQLNFKNGIANSCGYIGIVFAEQGDYLKALDYYFKALKSAEELGNKKTIATQLGNIGNIYNSHGDYPKALNYYFKALKIHKEARDKNGIANWLGNIANVYNNQGDYPKALEYYFKALKITEELGNKNGTASNLCNIGVVYDDQGDYPKAFGYYFSALKIAGELGNKKDIAALLSNIGSLYTTTGKYKEAEQYLKKAIVFSDNIGSLNYLKQTEESLSQLYDTTGRHKEALIHYKKAIALKDIIFSQENKKQLVRKEMNYEFDKKETATKTETGKQQAIAEENSRKQKIIIWSVASGLLSILAFAGFIFRSLRITRKQKNIIELQKNELTRQKDIADSQRIIAMELRGIAENQKTVAENQKRIVEEKQKEIVDSITYAKRIQTALLTSDEYIKKNLSSVLPNRVSPKTSGVAHGNDETSDYFILYKPKDIVSGDFYWALSTQFLPGWDMGTNNTKLPLDELRKNLFYMTTADCTGHGVPGAFMSMLNISILNEIVMERNIYLPHDILNTQRKEIIRILNPAGSNEESKDGMDCTLCVYDFNKMLLHFAAANNPLWLLRNSELIEYKADKMPVGKHSEDMHSFTLQTIELQKGDIIYTSTDGFADQFDTNDNRMTKKKFKERLLEIHHQPMSEQKEYLDQFFENWKGNTEQVDDVCVIGIRI